MLKTSTISKVIQKTQRRRIIMSKVRNVKIQAEFKPMLQLSQEMIGVIQKPRINQTIVNCEFNDQGEIILPPVVQEMLSFGGDNIQKPAWFLFTSEAGGPKPIMSNQVRGQVDKWVNGFARIVCDLDGKRLVGFPINQNKLQGAKVVFKKKGLCLVEAWYSAPKNVHLKIVSHQIDESGKVPKYQTEKIFYTKLDLAEDYLGALDDQLEEAKLGNFLAPASVALELGLKFPDGVKPCSPDLQKMTELDRATRPIYFKMTVPSKSDPGREEADSKETVGKKTATKKK